MNGGRSLIRRIKEDCYTLTDAASELGVAGVTVWRWVRDGKLKAHRIGRTVLIEKSEIERLRR